MKRFGIAIAVGLMLAPIAQAADKKPKRLSVGVGFGIRPDMASLGNTIAQDGTVDTDDSSLANLVYATDKALMSDRNNLVAGHNSANTGSTFNLLDGDKTKIGNPMLGGEIGGMARYDLDDAFKFPLYVQMGFHYTKKVSGGKQERTLGNAAAADPLVSQLLQANGENPDDYIGGTMKSHYDASWIEVPLTIGIKVPAKRKYTYAYAGVGASWFRGGFSVDIDVDEKYANVLTTHADLDKLTVKNYSPGAVQDKIDFKLGGMGMNWQLGVQSHMNKGLIWFAELNSSGTSKTVYGSKMKTETQQLLTATSSDSLAENDPQWFKRLAFPVVTTGAAIRTGVRYYFF